MQYATFDVSARAENDILLGEVLTAPAMSALETIGQFDRAGDGTASALFEFGPSLPSPERAFDSPATIDYATFDTGDSVRAFLHFEMPETMAALTGVVREQALVISYPIEAQGRSGLRITLVGFQEALQNAFSELHRTYDLRVECMGAYREQCNRLVSELTPKQRETLKAAVDAGYYDVPRRATHEDVAGILGRADATVGEHLRKVEARVLTALVR